MLREKETEPVFTGKHLKNKKNGIYVCTGCGNELFSSDTKFDSGTGWPSFWASSRDNIEEKEDNRFGMHRTEVTCKKCGGHLGHVFDDSPTLRVNVSASTRYPSSLRKRMNDFVSIQRTNNYFTANGIRVSSTQDCHHVQ